MAEQRGSAFLHHCAFFVVKLCRATNSRGSFVDVAHDGTDYCQLTHGARYFVGSKVCYWRIADVDAICRYRLGLVG